MYARNAEQFSGHRLKIFSFRGIRQERENFHALNAERKAIALKYLRSKPVKRPAVMQVLLLPRRYCRAWIDTQGETA